MLDKLLEKLNKLDDLPRKVKSAIAITGVTLTAGAVGGLITLVIRIGITGQVNFLMGKICGFCFIAGIVLLVSSAAVREAREIRERGENENIHKNHNR